MLTFLKILKTYIQVGFYPNPITLLAFLDQS